MLKKKELYLLLVGIPFEAAINMRLHQMKAELEPTPPALSTLYL
jgi:hypothetical protein